MPSRLIITIVLVCVLISLLGVFWRKNWTSTDLKTPIETTGSDRSWQKIQIKDQTWTVEVVTTPQAMTLGLSGRDSIGSDGMLFILSEPQVAQFWMKDMKFDLDLVWIGGGRIVGITPMVPAPKDNRPDNQLPIYVSPSQTDMVLEVPAGLTQTQGWQVGDQVVLW